MTLSSRFPSLIFQSSSITGVSMMPSFQNREFLKTYIYFFVCVCVSVCYCLWRPEADVGSPGIWFIGNCELTKVECWEMKSGPRRAADFFNCWAICPLPVFGDSLQIHYSFLLSFLLFLLSFLYHNSLFLSPPTGLFPNLPFFLVVFSSFQIVPHFRLSCLIFHYLF